MPIRLTVLLSVALVVGCSKSTTAPSTTPTGPTTETFTSALTIGGTSSHNFVLSQSGTIKVTLTTVGPTPTKVGLGVGIPFAGTACTLNTTVQADAGSAPQLTLQADAGSYCVQVYDIGGVKDRSTFTLTVEHP